MIVGRPGRRWLSALASAGLIQTACHEPPAAPRSRAKPATATSTLGAPTSTAAAAPARPELVYRSHRAMGTQITLTAYTTDPAGAVLAFDDAFREFDRLEALMTTWREDSEISRLNAAAGKRPVPITPELFDALARAQALSVLTSGKFDVTFGVMAGLWKFDQDQDDSIPPHAEIRKRIALIDYRKLVLDRPNQTAYLTRAGMKVHLGGIGKGFGVDRAVAILRRAGVRDFMVQAGGDLYVAGRHGDRPWRVGIRDPRGTPDKYFAASEVTDATFSTSGDYERSFISGGKRYHHIIDPATGAPATASRSVTVMAPDATTAEGLSKGVFILGPEKGLALVEQVEGAGVVIVDAKNQVHISSRLAGKVKILFPPTGGL